MELEVKLLIQDLKGVLNRGVKIKIFTKKLPDNDTPTSTIPIKVIIKR